MRRRRWRACGRRSIMRGRRRSSSRRWRMRLRRSTYSFGLNQDRVQVRGAVRSVGQGCDGGSPHPEDFGALPQRSGGDGAGSSAEESASKRVSGRLLYLAECGRISHYYDELCHYCGSDGFRVYIHRDVPTNDGGLSLGQAVIAAVRLRAELRG
ncbi:MAG: hypothetical protein MZV64_60100 [Ignavibacteriales bacterium]|nr:hypothetical protein [Ignavibacteriales bacterium]